MRSNLNALAALALATVTLGACATTEPTAATSPDDPAAERGRWVAARVCGGCHAVGLYGASPNLASPPLRDLCSRYNVLSLEDRLADIARGGHYEMPPVELSRDEIADLAAYMETLGPR